MAKNLYKAKFEDNLPLGGIATGHITLGCDGSITAQAPTFFAIKAEKGGELLDARILQSSQSEAVILPCFENASAASFFPFTEICFSGSSFPFDVKMTAFSPFIPLSDTDSGIPAVLFELEVTNKEDSRVDCSVCLVSANVNRDGINRMGCTDTGEAYIHLSGNGKDAPNTCIATGGKNVSFCEYTCADAFIKNFTENETLYNTTKSEYSFPFASGALCTHFSLGKGEVKKVSFCLSWYSPENEFSRNYYAQYFESGLECASYVFRQKERLHGASTEFCQNILGATLPESVLEEVNKDLFLFTGKGYIRLDDGCLMSGERIRFSDTDSFICRSDILASMFPDLSYSETESFYKSGMFDSASDEDMLTHILASYRKYILCGDNDSLIEDWYYISKCMEKVFGEDGNIKSKADRKLMTSAIGAAVEMADAVKDKKRHELYSSMLDNMPPCQTSMDIAEGYAKINEISRFEYNAVSKHIGFSPDSDACPLDFGNTFRCFFCTPTCYGYVEEGIDYIEINLLHGVLTVRSFGVPRTPRLVQYGGRNWKFTNENLVAVLDSDLEITPQKKLTIFIDIKQ